MLKIIVKNFAPLVLFLALFFLTGTVSATISPAGHDKADACCQDGTSIPADPASPSADAECTDAGCGCLSCSVPLLFESFSTPPLQDSTLSYWTQAWSLPSAPDRSIDYPPEFS